MSDISKEITKKNDVAEKKSCSTYGCSEKHFARGFCKSCYRKDNYRRNGTYTRAVDGEYMGIAKGIMEELIEKRKALDISLIEMARLMNITTTRMRLIENTANPKLNVLIEYLECIGMDIMDVFTE